MLLVNKALWNPQLVTQCDSKEHPNCSSLVFLSSISRKPELELIIEEGFVPRMVVYPNSYRMEKDRFSLKGICSDFDLRFEEVEDDDL